MSTISATFVDAVAVTTHNNSHPHSPVGFFYAIFASLPLIIKMGVFTLYNCLLISGRAQAMVRLPTFKI
jgi:hypothetical protein